MRDLLLGHMVLQLWLVLPKTQIETKILFNEAALLSLLQETTTPEQHMNTLWQGGAQTAWKVQICFVCISLTVLCLWGKRSWRSGWLHFLRWTSVGRRRCASRQLPGWSRCTPPPDNTRPPYRPHPPPLSDWFSLPPGNPEDFFCELLTKKL